MDGVLRKAGLQVNQEIVLKASVLKVIMLMISEGKPFDMRSKLLALPLLIGLSVGLAACSDTQQSVVQEANANNCENVDEFVLQIFRDARARSRLSGLGEIPENLRFGMLVFIDVRNDMNSGMDLADSFMRAVPAAYRSGAEDADESAAKVAFSRQCEPYIRRLLAIEDFRFGILTGER